MVVLVAFSPPLALPSGVCGTLDFSLSRLRLGGSPRRLGGRAPCGRVRVVPFHLWPGRD